MPEPDAPPRLLRRVLAWLIGALILLPTLYVAMLGPLRWYAVNHDRDLPWLRNHYDTLHPLYQVPQIASFMNRYEEWWDDLPPPRSWERAKIVREIEQLKAMINDASAAEQKWREQTARVESAMKRLRVLLNQPETQPGRDEEITHLKAELEKEIQLASACQPDSAGQTRSDLQIQLDAAELRLRQFDAR